MSASRRSQGLPLPRLGMAELLMAAPAAFSKISRDADDLIAVAVRSLEDVDAKVRLSATLILEKIGPAAMPQVLAMARGEPRADGGLVMRLLLKMDPRRDLPDIVGA